MRVQAAAKVNLALDVLGLREDGYHELDMIMAPCSIYDELIITPSSSGKHEVTFEGQDIPEKNTVTKTLQAFEKRGLLKQKWNVHVVKKIPSQAGLGGASADAAALLNALDVLENLELTTKRKLDIAVEVGADVPFCLFNQFSRVKGKGDRLAPLPIQWKIPVLLVKPDEGVSTKECFDAIDRQPRRKPLDIDIVQDALAKKDIALLYQTMDNALQDTAFDLVPVLETIRDELNDAGIVKVLLTGSGSTMMGFCIDEEVMENACQKMKDRYPFVQIAYIG